MGSNNQSLQLARKRSCLEEGSLGCCSQGDVRGGVGRDVTHLPFTPSLGVCTEFMNKVDTGSWMLTITSRVNDRAS